LIPRGPLVNLILVGKYRLPFPTRKAVHGQSFFLFPPFDRRHVAAQIVSDLFPRIQALAFFFRHGCRSEFAPAAIKSPLKPPLVSCPNTYPRTNLLIRPLFHIFLRSTRVQ